MNKIPGFLQPYTHNVPALGTQSGLLTNTPGFAQSYQFDHEKFEDLIE